jgi:hypothetical protein
MLAIYLDNVYRYLAEILPNYYLFIVIYLCKISFIYLHNCASFEFFINYTPQFKYVRAARMHWKRKKEGCN